LHFNISQFKIIKEEVKESYAKKPPEGGFLNIWREEIYYAEV